MTLLANPLRLKCAYRINSAEYLYVRVYKYSAKLISVLLICSQSVLSLLDQ